MVETRKQMTEEIHKSQQSFSKHYDKTKRVVDEALKPGAKVWLRFEWIASVKTESKRPLVRNQIQEDAWEDFDIRKTAV